MASGTRVIRRRIKSVTNTRKITKAMELVASAKMRRAVQSVTGTRPYAALATETIQALLGSSLDQKKFPLLRESGKREKVLLIAIFSDRGLCGGYNAQLIRKLSAVTEMRGRGTQIDVIAVGKRGIDTFRRWEVPVIAAFTNFVTNPTWSDVAPISKLAIDAFVDGIYDEVLIAFTDFKSAVLQIPQLRSLLPIKLSSIGDTEKQKELNTEYLFEPDADAVLSAFLPRLVETQVYQAMLESTASEHAARMFAMRSASDSANEMIDDLTFTANQARQASITREISEISAGKAALE